MQPGTYPSRIELTGEGEQELGCVAFQIQVSEPKQASPAPSPGVSPTPSPGGASQAAIGCLWIVGLVVFGMLL